MCLTTCLFLPCSLRLSVNVLSIPSTPIKKLNRGLKGSKTEKNILTVFCICPIWDFSKLERTIE